MLPPDLPLPAFASRWTPESLAAARTLLDATVRAARAGGAAPMLEGGTLLGHVRHREAVIPWDDDLDLAVDREMFEPCVRAIGGEPGLSVQVVANARYGTFAQVRRSGAGAAGAGAHWPAVDLFPFAVEGAKVRFYASGRATLAVERSDVLPLRDATFEGVMVACPARADRVLDAMFPNWRIEFDSGGWDHRHDRPREKRQLVRWNPAANPPMATTPMPGAPIAALCGRLFASGLLQRLALPSWRPRRARRGRVVYTDMCADLFHAGHVNFLRQARALGDWLVVGIHDDATIAGYKGAPVQTLEERVAAVAACRHVDQVVPGAPLEVSPRYLDALGVDVVCHADEIDAAARDRMYGEILASHGLELVPYTSGISTRELRARVLAAAPRDPSGNGDRSRQ